jgi:ABC-type branched-subunit amino acid transport system ATPase component
VLVLFGIDKQFAGVTALRSVDLDVFRGEVLGLIGPNGAGKSTLINVATGHYRPTTGSIRLQGRDITRMPVHRRVRLGIGRTFQAVRLFDHLTVAENVRLASRQGREMAEWLDLDRLESLLPRELSYADQRKLQIAQALALGSRALFLDEPSIGMSASELEELGQIIAAARDAGTAVVLVDHNLDLVMELADRIAVLDFGRKIADDQPAAVVADATVQAAYLGDAAVTAAAT